jgi:hypothetical protein
MFLGLTDPHPDPLVKGWIRGSVSTSGSVPKCHGSASLPFRLFFLSNTVRESEKNLRGSLIFIIISGLKLFFDPDLIGVRIHFSGSGSRMAYKGPPKRKKPKKLHICKKWMFFCWAGQKHTAIRIRSRKWELFVNCKSPVTCVNAGSVYV